MEVNFKSVDSNLKITYIDNLPEDDMLYELHDACEIVYYLKTDMEIFINNVRYAVKDGDIAFFDEYDIHKIIYHNKKQYIRYLLTFKKSYIIEILKLMDICDVFEKLLSSQFRIIGTNLKNRGITEQVFINLLRVAGNPEYENDRFSQASSQLLLVLLLMHLADLTTTNSYQHNFNKKGQEVYNIINYIDSNFSMPLELDMFEKEFNFSKFYLCKIFKEVTGFHITEYIQYRRIVEAQKMLKSSTKSPIEICYDCGFNNIPHFYRVFKKIVKVSPVKFRKSSV